MNLIRQLLAVFLSVFLSFSALAADNKKESKKKDRDYPYFKLGVRPINSSGVVDWGRECVVTITEDSPPVRMFYKSSDGFVKLSAFGIIRAPEDIVVNAKTGFALHPRICSNGIANPTDWIPVGTKKCAEVEKAEASPSGAPGAFVAPPDTYKSFTVPDPEYRWGIKPDGLKKLNLEDESKAPESSPVTVKGDDKDKSPTWPYWVGGGVAVLTVIALVLSKKGKDAPKPTGGPAGDPPNSILSFSW